jgi:sigma-B regulation protein RsbU (phosphoserine phosphatase)
MEIQLTHGRLDPSAGPLRRAFDYAFYDWTREMPRSRRILTWTGILIQGYAIYAGFVRSLIWPLMWPKGLAVFPVVFVLYLLGNCLMNAMLTSEFVRKTQLEADQTAARQIQQTLIPQNVEPPPGYQMETFYRPYREVGGDYFDIIGLPGNRTLIALADVSGKGMAAALLAANIQALVRSIAGTEPDPGMLAARINQHLGRYTPSDRFATAVFLLLQRDSGNLAYVNAGHEPPIILQGDSAAALEATGLPLGLMAGSQYEVRAAQVPGGGALLLFTDGLTDSISGDNPRQRLREALTGDPGSTMSNLKSLLDPKLNQDDVTILLLKRADDGRRGVT